MKSPKNTKPIEAEITDHEAAMPTLNASCEVPMVDFAPMYSDISRMAITTAGVERPATMNCSVVLLRSRMLIQAVTTMYTTTIAMMMEVSHTVRRFIDVSDCCVLNSRRASARCGAL